MQTNIYKTRWMKKIDTTLAKKKEKRKIKIVAFKFFGIEIPSENINNSNNNNSNNEKGAREQQQQNHSEYSEFGVFFLLPVTFRCVREWMNVFPVTS